MRRAMRGFAALGPLAALVLAGCGVDAEIAPELTAEPPARVAILPFEAPDVDERGSLEMRFIRRIYHANWANLPFRDLPLEIVDHRLKLAGLDTLEAVKAAPPARLGELLGVDAVVHGHIESMSNIAPLIAFRRAMSGTFELVDCRSGKSLWKADYTESSWGGPLLESGQFIKGIRNQIENSGSLAFYKTADRLCRKIVETVPPIEKALDPAQFTPKFDPSVPVAVKFPSDRQIVPGDRIEVRFGGDPGCQASFDVGLYRQNVPMAEVAPGKYAGVYVVQVGDAFDSAPVRVEIRTAFDESATAEAPGLVVNVRARPPEPPAELALRVAGGEVVLNWKKPVPAENRGELQAPPSDAVAFTVLRAYDAPLAFTEVGEVRGATEWREPAPQGRTAFYQVLALDAQGNRSYPTPTVSTTEPGKPNTQEP